MNVSAMQALRFDELNFGISEVAVSFSVLLFLVSGGGGIIQFGWECGLLFVPRTGAWVLLLGWWHWVFWVGLGFGGGGVVDGWWGGNGFLGWVVLRRLCFLLGL